MGNGSDWRSVGSKRHGAFVTCRSAGPRAFLRQTPGLPAAMLAAALLSSCALGPDFGPPPAPETNGYTPGRLPAQTASSNINDGKAQRFAKGRDIPGDWWRVFSSRPLKSLVEKALRNNPDLAAAQAALRVAQANVSAGKGAFYPSIDGGFSATRQQSAIGGPVDDPSQLGFPPIFNLLTGQVLVSYTPDVFGGTRRNVESLQAQSDNQRFTLEATYLTLTSNLVLAAVQEASLRGQIEATKTIIKLATDFLRLLRTQFSAGQISEADVVAQEASLAQVEQTLPPLQKQLAQQRHLLIALAGGLPDRDLPEKFDLSGLHLPRDLPLSLPSELVQQRPDMRAAEENLHSASALIGVAITNRLPNLTLSGNIGSSALYAEQLFTPGTGFWSLSGAVLTPIFHGGTLFQQEVAARATFEQASSQYRSTVVNAFQNVADALSAIENDAVSLQKAVAAEEAAKKSVAIMRRRLELGDVNYLLLLNAQQTYQQALLTRVQAQASRLSDTAALFQALGGGWWNREDVDPPKLYPLFSPFE
jgi:NodT family efflux transporter outer membrane factor (OMF) lipoprotein